MSAVDCKDLLLEVYSSQRTGMLVPFVRLDCRRLFFWYHEAPCNQFSSLLGTQQGRQWLLCRLYLRGLPFVLLFYFRVGRRSFCQQKFTIFQAPLQNPTGRPSTWFADNSYSQDAMNPFQHHCQLAAEIYTLEIRCIFCLTTCVLNL